MHPMRSALLSFTRSLERYVLEVSFGERRGMVANLTRYQLLLCSKVFDLAIKVRRFVLGRNRKNRV